MSSKTQAPVNATTKPSLSADKSGLLQRQCACGNSAGLTGECATCQTEKLTLQRKQTAAQDNTEVPPIAHEALSLPRVPMMQAKLTIGASDDPLEREADRVADQVMAAPTHPVVSDAPPRIQRFTGQPTGNTDTAAPASIDRVLSSPGSPLEPGLQQDMGQRFGHDFSQVRIHTDAAAERSARVVNANAYTVGQDIVFGASRFAPETHEGRRLIAHELTHVIQQSGAEACEKCGTQSMYPSNKVQLQRQPNDVVVIPQSVVIGVEKFPPPATLGYGDLVKLIDKLIEIWRKDGLAQLQVEITLPGYLAEVDKILAAPVRGILKPLTKIAFKPTKLYQIPMRQGETRDSYPPSVRDRLIPVSSAQSQPDTEPKAAASAKIPSPTMASKSVSEMTGVEKLVEAYNRANIKASEREKLASLVTPEALAIAFISFVLTFIAAQLTPVGWTADIGIALTGIFIGSSLFAAMEHLIKFADARNAIADEQLDQAGAEFAAAVAEIEIDAIILIVTHGVGGGSKGGTPFKGSSSARVVLGTTEQGFVVPVLVETVPAQAISRAQAAQLGAKGAAAATALYSRGSGAGKRRGNQETDDKNYRDQTKQRQEERAQERANKSAQQKDSRDIDILSDGYVEFFSGDRPRPAYKSVNEAFEAFKKSEGHPNAKLADAEPATGNNFHTPGKHLGLREGDVYVGTLFEGQVMDPTTNEVITVWTFSGK
jgi:hypothetical protein